MLIKFNQQQLAKENQEHHVLSVEYQTKNVSTTFFVELKENESFRRFSNC